MVEPAPRNITLALQGGGAHGAFTWGVLDRLLEDPRLRITAISGTSAGALNAAVLAAGLQRDGVAGARAALDDFWRTISRYGAFSPFSQSAASPWAPWVIWMEGLARLASPYDVNPLNLDPLRRTLEQSIDFEQLRDCTAIKLFVSATNVLSGALKVFTTPELSVDSLLASACLPRLHHAVRIGDDHFWDGGYMGNPVLEPLLAGCDASDVLIVQVNPTRREALPRGAEAIDDRINEITFNASLMREIRSIAHLNRLVEHGLATQGTLTQMFLHMIGAEEVTSGLGLRSKFDTRWTSLTRLRDAGRRKADEFLDAHFAALGKSTTLALSEWAPTYALPGSGKVT